MTSHIINRVGERDREYVDDCVFCDIAAHRQSAYIVAESSSYVAFLDILPIRTGHTVVIPKSHVSRLSSMCPAQASAMMQGVTAVARAMEEAFGIIGLQVVANQVYAQTIDHVHFHVVPAPLETRSNSILAKWDRPSRLNSIGRRDELDDDEGKELQRLMISCLQHPKL